MLITENRLATSDPRPGSIGRPYPGAEIRLLDDQGAPVATGEPGEIAVGRGSQSMFLRYWQDPESTRDSFGGPDEDWLLTGDLGVVDEDGYVWFESRRDDVIVSAGYRIGPSEIEHCLCSFPGVTDAAVVGLPDPDRGSIVAAFVELGAGAVGEADGIEARLSSHVADQLSPFQRPRRIEVVASLPRTTTGKVRRAALREGWTEAAVE